MAIASLISRSAPAMSPRCSAITPSAFFADATLGSSSSALPEELLGARQVSAIQPDLAHLVVDERILRVERQVVLEAGQRRVVVAQPAVGLRQVEDREVVVRLQAQRPLEVLDRLCRLVVAQVLRAQHEPGVDHLGSSRTTSLSKRDDLERTVPSRSSSAFFREVGRGAELVEEADLVLRIGAPGPGSDALATNEPT